MKLDDRLEPQNRTLEAGENRERTGEEQNSDESSHTVEKPICPNNQTHDSNARIKAEKKVIRIQRNTSRLNLN